jgi:hypothetical protein
MKKLLAIAALLLASTAAQAQYTFEYGGRTIRVDPDRGTVQIPGIYDNTGRKAKRARSEDSDRPRKPSPQQAKTNSQTAPDTPGPTAPSVPTAPAPSEQAAVPVAPAASPATPAPVMTAPAEPATATATIAPPDPGTLPAPPPPASTPAPQVQQQPAPVPRPEPQPAVAAVTPTPAPPQAAPQAANSPLGVWLTEEKEGKVRIEACGANLCGYSVDKKSNQNREQVLISMKPGRDKWSGRIFDSNSDSTYDSTIALKGTNSLRVQGCAFGGMFCGS